MNYLYFIILYYFLNPYLLFDFIISNFIDMKNAYLFYDTVKRVSSAIVSHSDPLVDIEIQNDNNMKTTIMTSDAVARVIAHSEPSLSKVFDSVSAKQTITKMNSIIMTDDALKRVIDYTTYRPTPGAGTFLQQKKKLITEMQHEDNVCDTIAVPGGLRLEFLRHTVPTKGRPLNFKKAYDSHQSHRWLYNKNLKPSQSEIKHSQANMRKNHHIAPTPQYIPTCELPPRPMRAPKNWYSKQEKRDMLQFNIEEEPQQENWAVTDPDAEGFWEESDLNPEAPEFVPSSFTPNYYPFLRPESKIKSKIDTHLDDIKTLVTAPIAIHTQSNILAHSANDANWADVTLDVEETPNDSFLDPFLDYPQYPSRCAYYMSIFSDYVREGKIQYLPNAPIINQPIAKTHRFIRPMRYFQDDWDETRVISKMICTRIPYGFELIERVSPKLFSATNAEIYPTRQYFAEGQDFEPYLEKHPIEYLISELRCKHERWCFLPEFSRGQVKHIKSYFGPNYVVVRCRDRVYAMYHLLRREEVFDYTQTIELQSLFTTPIITQSFSSMLNVVLDPIRNAVSFLLEKLQDYLTTTLVSVQVEAFKTKVKTFLANFFAEAYDKTPLILGLASYIYDKFTDLRPFSFGVLAADLARLSFLLPFVSQFVDIFKYLCNEYLDTTFLRDTHYVPSVGYTRETDEVNIDITTQAGADPFSLIIDFLGKILPFSAETLRKLQLFNNLATALKTTGAAFRWIFNLLPNCITDYLVTNKAARWQRECSNPEGLYNVFMSASLLLQDARRAGKTISKEMIISWQSAYDALSVVFDDPDFKVPPGQMSRIRDLYRELVHLQPTAVARETEPTWFYFYGRSKIGKSLMVPSLVKNILSKPDLLEAQKAIYTRNTAEEYWNGYNPKEHKVCLYDDLGAINSPQRPHADLLEMIHLVSGAAYIVPMATLDDPSVGKKGTVFDSDTIISLSNCPEYSVPEMTHQEALYNRQHFIIHVDAHEHVKPDYLRFTHLKFHIKSMSGKPYSECACKRERDVQEDVLCYVCRKPRQQTFTFNELCRFVKLMVYIKKSISELLTKNVNTDESFNKYNAAFNAEDHIMAELVKSYSIETQSDEIFVVDGMPIPDPQFERVTTRWATKLKDTAWRLGYHFKLIVHDTAKDFVDTTHHVFTTSLRILRDGLVFILGSLAVGAGFNLIDKAIDIVRNLWRKKSSAIQIELESADVMGHRSKYRNEIRLQTENRLRVPGIVSLEVFDLSKNRSFNQCGWVPKGYNCLTTAHSFGGSPGPFNISLTYYRNGVLKHATASLDRDKLKFVKGKDLVHIDLTSTEYLPAPDWSKHVRDDPLPETFTGNMAIVRPDGEIVQYVGKCVTQSKCVFTDQTGEEYSLATVVSAQFPTVEGDCGGVVMYRDRVISMHFGAGTASDKAYSIPLTTSDTAGTNVIDPFQHFGIIPQSSEHAWAHDSDKILSLGTIPKEFVQYSPSKTQIRPSSICGLYPILTEPSVLSPHDSRNKSGHHPLYNGTRKYGIPTRNLGYNLLARAPDVLDDLMRVQTGVRSGILTRDQALNGDATIPHCIGVDLTTSCGFGYPATQQGKRAHITLVDGRYRVTSEILKNRLEYLEQQLDNSIVPQIVIDCLKDERRKPAKIQSGDTRVFNIYPMEYTILMQQYFGRFTSHFMSLHEHGSPICVGMNPYSTQWHDTITRLAARSDICFDGDGASFDATFPLRELMLTIIDAMVRWITKDMPISEAIVISNRARNLAISGINAYHLCDSYAYTTVMGVLSGWFLTTMVNSFTIYLHLYFAYLSRVPVQLANHKSFKDNTELMIFGDDHTSAITRVILPYFNFQTVSEYFRNLGMTYTAGTKVALETRTHWPLMETTFLKNSIGRLGHYYVPLLQQNVIYDMVSWVRKSDDTLSATQTNCAMALRFMFFYGKTAFNRFRNELLTALPTSTFHTFEELESIFNVYGSWEEDYLSSLALRKQPNITMSTQHNKNTPSNEFISTQSAILDLAKPFTNIIDAIIPHEIQADALGFLGSLDKPTYPDVQDKTRLTFYPNFNAVKTIDRSIPLRADPSAMTLTDEQHFKREDEMTIKHITAIPTSILQAIGPNGQTIQEWSTSQASGTTIFVELVSPNTELHAWGAQILAGSQSSIVPTSVCYASVPFHHWRGTIDYELEVFASQGFHKGSLRFSFHPGVYSIADIPTEIDKSSQYYTELDLTSTTRKIRFSVPFDSRYPWLELCNFSANDEASLRRAFTGLVCVTVVRKLIASGVASPTIGFTVRRAAGPDLEFANMDTHNLSVQKYASAWETVPFVTQSLDTSATTANLASLQLADVSTGTVMQTTSVDSVVSNVSAPISTSQTHGRNLDSVVEKSWSIADALDKRSLADIFSWLPTDFNQKLLASYSVPNDLTVTELNSIARNRFVNTRCDVEITAEVAGSPFQSGALAMVWFPLVSKANFTNGAVHNGFAGSPTQIDFMQHVLLQPGTNNTYKMVIDYRHPQTSLYLGKGDSLGTLCFIVYYPLATVAGDNPVTISVHARLLNANITTPRPSNITSSSRMLNSVTQMDAIHEYEDARRAFSPVNASKRLEETENQLANERRQAETKLLATKNMRISIMTQSRTMEVPPKEINPTVPLENISTATVMSKDPTSSTTSNSRRRDRSNAAHFEDIVTDIQQLSKKFSQAYYTEINLSPGSTIVPLDIANDLLFSDSTGVAKQYNGSGVHGWFGSVYRAFRGDIRLKFALQVGVDSGYPLQQIHGYVTTSQEALPIAGTAATGLLTVAMLTPPPLVVNKNITPLSPNNHYFIISPANPEVVEIEVPYSRLAGFSLVPSYAEVISDDPYGLGVAYIVFDNPSNYNISVYLRVHAAFSDAARFGIPFTIPRVTILPGLVPDSWVTPTSEEFEELSLTEK